MCDTLKPIGGLVGAASSGRPVLVGDERPAARIAAEEARQLEPGQRTPDDKALPVCVEVEALRPETLVLTQHAAIALQLGANVGIVLVDDEHVDDVLGIGIDHVARGTS